MTSYYGHHFVYQFQKCLGDILNLLCLPNEIMIIPTLQINLLGTSFSIQADEDSLYLEKLLAHYKETVDDLMYSTDLKDPLKVAILAGIMIADELAKERRNVPDTDTLMVNAELSEAEKIVLQLTKKIDQVL